ncbi:hypothetical protein N0V94_007913 [Neodidymelliopsis sp. IMI 364377]|nr:hypothetical protein N0V94_007913 [Neodidymelliopsis sp. IMI 364377]
MRGQHSGLSEPVIVRYFDGTTGKYAVRLLKRLQEDLEDLARQMGRTEIADNELILTSQVANIAPSQIEGACDIRFVPQKNVLDQQIPFPYRCGGTGDHWFVSMRLSDDAQHLFWMDRTLLALMGPSDDPILQKKLRGLSLFSGGGGLDRGLEAAGAVEIKIVVEIDPAAIHTQRANSQNPDRVRFYCGSVNDYLKDSLLEPSNDIVAAIGEVDIILAGCPCQGLSAIQNNRQSERSLKNTSLVTTFCSFVDLLRPDRGILENVAAIGFNRIDRGKRQRGTEENSNDTEEDTEEQRTQNTLSQIIACLVSMGYQVNHFVMNSPDYGSVQRRSRMMITIAAPGLSPMEKPPQTHRPLDHSSNGSSLEQYSCSNAPFTQLVAGDRIGDLPNIGNGIVQMIEFSPFKKLGVRKDGPTRRSSLALSESNTR